MNSTNPTSHIPSAQLQMIANLYDSEVKQSMFAKGFPGFPQVIGLDGVIKPDQDTNVADMRLLPHERPLVPTKFWHEDWCYYQVGVGNFPCYEADQGKGAFTWSIGFLHAPNNSHCSKGKYSKDVINILEGAAREWPGAAGSVFTVRRGDLINNSRPSAYIHLFRRYYHKEFATFDNSLAQLIARDLLWFVNQTYPKFRSLS